MKKITSSIIPFFAWHILYCQIKTFEIVGNDYLKPGYSNLHFYIPQEDSLQQKKFGIYNDSLIQHWPPKKVKTIDKLEQPTLIKISELDSAFNLITELKGKVYFLNNHSLKHFYYLKNDSFLIHKHINRHTTWELIKEQEHKIYKVNLGTRIIYWINDVGIIYKKYGAIQSYLYELGYFYKDNEISLKSLDSVDMSVGYFDYGPYKISKQEPPGNRLKWKVTYTVSKNNQPILDSLSLKYYNSSGLIAYNKNILKFYNANMHLDSQFIYRDFNDKWDTLEFLISNKIKQISIHNYSSIEDGGIWGNCGNVSRYSLKISKDFITEFGDHGHTISYKKKKLKPAFQNDSMFFINRKKVMKWDDNGGFNHHIILFKNGKEGLFRFSREDSFIELYKILPIEFDKIHSLNEKIILNKNDREEFLDYYLQNKIMRFRKINYENSSYLRYKKIDNKEGWTTQGFSLFDDL